MFLDVLPDAQLNDKTTFYTCCEVEVTIYSLVDNHFQPQCKKLKQILTLHLASGGNDMSHMKDRHTQGAILST